MAQPKRKSAPEPQKGNAARHRDAIDRGRTGDKVAASDPAAAPMGTDAETAGTPTSAKAEDAATREQTELADETARHQPAYGRNEQPRAGARSRRIWIGTAIAVLVIVGILAALGLV